MFWVSLKQYFKVPTELFCWKISKLFITQIEAIKNSEYDQEISQIADNPMAPQGRATQPSRDTRKTN